MKAHPIRGWTDAIQRLRSLRLHRRPDARVNAAITLQRPLLVKGEPGTGKTMLAVEVAKALGLPLLEWHIKSTTKAQQGPVRVRRGEPPARFAARRPRVHEIRNYIMRGMLWQAFTSETPVVLLIDEIDKADIEFPNDLCASSTAWSSSCTKRGSS